MLCVNKCSEKKLMCGVTWREKSGRESGLHSK